MPNLENLRWETYGGGTEILLAFHGYGQQPKVFEPLLSRLPHYRVIAFYFPVPPNYSDRQPIENHLETFENEMKRFFETEKQAKVSVVGFSIGARTALFLTEQFPQKVKKLTLIAPDGIVENPYFSFLTRNWLGKALFRWASSPSLVTGFLFSALLELPLLRRYRMPVARQFGTAVQRRQLFSTWQVMRYFKADLAKMQRLSKQNGIESEVLLAADDHLINSKKCRLALQKFWPRAKIEWREMGHYQVFRNWIGGG